MLQFDHLQLRALESNVMLYQLPLPVALLASVVRLESTLDFAHSDTARTETSCTMPDQLIASTFPGRRVGLGYAEHVFLLRFCAYLVDLQSLLLNKWLQVHVFRLLRLRNCAWSVASRSNSLIQLRDFVHFKNISTN